MRRPAGLSGFVRGGLLALCFAQPAVSQWERLPLATEATFRAVHAPDEKSCWIGGAAGQVWRTADGGNTWIRCAVPPGGDSLDFRDIHAFSATEALVMSIGEAEKGKARIFRTTDGGAGWDLVFSTEKPGVFLDAMDFCDSRNGICLGDPVDGRFYLITTTDGGRSWSELPAARRPPADRGEAAFAASGSSVVMPGCSRILIGTGGAAHARILKSENHGETWEAITTSLAGGPESGIFGLKFFTPEKGVALAGNYRKFKEPGPNLIYTGDGGKTWHAAGPVPPGGLMESAGIYKGSYLVAAGHSGSSYSGDGGRTWHLLDKEPWHAVSFAGTVGYGVGAGGLVARFRGIP